MPLPLPWRAVCWSAGLCRRLSQICPSSPQWCWARQPHPPPSLWPSPHQTSPLHQGHRPLPAELPSLQPVKTNHHLSKSLHCDRQRTYQQQVAREPCTDLLSCFLSILLLYLPLSLFLLFLLFFMFVPCKFHKSHTLDNLVKHAMHLLGKMQPDPAGRVYLTFSSFALLPRGRVVSCIILWFLWWGRWSLQTKGSPIPEINHLHQVFLSMFKGAESATMENICIHLSKNMRTGKTQCPLHVGALGLLPSFTSASVRFPIPLEGEATPLEEGLSAP